MKAISFVIPAYNAGNTIVRTMESILNTGIPIDDMEIIVVDDCSKDNTREVVRDFAQLHSQVQLLCQPQNHRHGAARNRGLLVANGEYVMFVDADDTVSKGVKEQWQLANENKPDVVCGEMAEIEHGKVTDIHATNMEPGMIVNGKEFCEQYFDFEIHVHPVIYLWRRAYLQKKGILFIADRRFEDADWIEQNLFYAQSVTYIDSVVYYYHHAESIGSTTNTLSSDTLGDWVNLSYRQWVFAEKIKTDSPRFYDKLINSSRHIVNGHFSFRRLTRFSSHQVKEIFTRVGVDALDYLASKEEWSHFPTLCFHLPRFVLFIIAVVHPLASIGRVFANTIRKIR